MYFVKETRRVREAHRHVRTSWTPETQQTIGIAKEEPAAWAKWLRLLINKQFHADDHQSLRAGWRTRHILDRQAAHVPALEGERDRRRWPAHGLLQEQAVLARRRVPGPSTPRTSRSPT
jgi:hypothetical protein